MIECDSRFVTFVVRCKLNRFAVKENDNITNTLRPTGLLPESV